MGQIEIIAQAIWESDQAEVLKSYPDHKPVDWDTLGHREDIYSNYQVYMRRASAAFDAMHRYMHWLNK